MFGNLFYFINDFSVKLIFKVGRLLIKFYWSSFCMRLNRIQQEKYQGQNIRANGRRRQSSRSKGHSSVSSQPYSACRSTFLLHVGNTGHTWSMLLLHRLSSRGEKQKFIELPWEQMSSPGSYFTLCSWCVFEGKNVQDVNKSFESSPGRAAPFLCTQWRVNNTSGCPRVPEHVTACPPVCTVTLCQLSLPTARHDRHWLTDGYLMLSGWE